MNTSQAYITQAHTKIRSLDAFLAMNNEKEHSEERDRERIEKSLIELTGRLEEYKRLIQELEGIGEPQGQADRFAQMKNTLNQAWAKVGYAETKLRAKLRALPS